MLGYSGLVGQALLELCIKSDQVYEILCLGRTQPPFTHYKLRWERSTLLEPGTDAGHYTAIDRVFVAWGPPFAKQGPWKPFAGSITKWWWMPVS